MAYERLTEPRVTMKWPLAKPRSFSNLPAFFDLDGRENQNYDILSSKLSSWKSHEKFEPFQEEATDLYDQTGIKLSGR